MEYEFRNLRQYLFINPLAIALKMNEMPVIKNTPLDVHNEIKAWHKDNATMAQWIDLLKFLESVRSTPKNIDLIGELRGIYAEIDFKAKGGICNRQGACCIPDVPATFIEYIYFMSPFMSNIAKGSSLLDKLYSRPPVTKVYDKKEDGVYQGPVCPMLTSKDGIDTACLVYEFRPSACRAMVANGIDCNCGLLADHGEYNTRIIHLSFRMNAPEELKTSLSGITRGWPTIIRDYLSGDKDAA